MRLSSWFLCPTLRLLPEASHPARIRLLFRVARTARKRGVGFVLRAQREPLQPLEAFGVEWAWVSWGRSSYGAITCGSIMRSEERRVGKEGTSRVARAHLIKH